MRARGPGFVLHEGRGLSSGSRLSMMMREALPVTGSTRSCTVPSSTMSPNLDAAAHFGEHGVGEGVPLRQHPAGLHLLPLLHLDVAPVGERVAFPFDALFADQDQFRLAAQIHELALAVDYHLGIVEPDPAPAPGNSWKLLLRRSGGGAADVEGAHGELGAGLADGLGGDDADGFAL